MKRMKSTIQEEAMKTLRSGLLELEQRLDGILDSTVSTIRQETAQKLDNAVSVTIENTMRDMVMPHIENVVSEMKTQINGYMNTLAGAKDITNLNKQVSRLSSDILFVKQLLENSVPKNDQCKLTEDDVDNLVRTQEFNRLLDDLCLECNHGLVLYAMRQIDQAGYDWMDANAFLIVSIANLVWFHSCFKRS